MVHPMQGQTHEKDLFPYLDLGIISFRFPIGKAAKVTYYQEQADKIVEVLYCDCKLGFHVF